jgi:cathepsin B
MLHNDLTGLNASYFLDFEPADTLEANANKTFFQFANMSGLADELTEKELEYFRERFVRRVSDSAEEQVFPYLQNTSAMHKAWKSASARAAEDEKPVVTEQMVNDTNEAALGWSAGAAEGKIANLSARDVRGLVGAHIAEEDIWDLQAEKTNASFRQEHRAALLALAHTWEPSREFDARTRWPECTSTISHVRDQGQCGDCWAMAAAGAIEDRLCIASNGTFSGASAFISAGYIASCGNRAKDGCSGGFVRRAMAWAAQQGVPTGGRGSYSHTCVPYFASGNSLDHFFAASHHSPPCPQTCTNYEYPRALGADLFFPEGMANTLTSRSFEMAKAALLHHGPIAMGFKVFSDFMMYKSGVYRPKEDAQEMGLHATQAIGFGPDYILGVNSWDKHWGEHGLFKIHHSAVMFYWLPGAILGVGSGYSYPLPDGPEEPEVAKCLRKNSMYLPDMEGSSKTVEASVLNCHRRCVKTNGCEFFSYWHDGVHDGHCHLQGEGAHEVYFGDVTAGPKLCEYGFGGEWLNYTNNNNTVDAPTKVPEDRPECWRAPSQCVETFTYKDFTYSGCTTVDLETDCRMTADGNVALGLKATSPDGYNPYREREADLAVDGNLSTWWEEEPSQPGPYIFSLSNTPPFKGYSFTGYAINDFAPKSWALLCDGSTIHAHYDYDSQLAIFVPV